MLNKIYIIGYYGYGNLGDEAMRMGLLDIMEYKSYDDIRCHEKGQSLLRNFIWADEIVLGGGTHLRDWGKHWFSQSVRILTLGFISRLLGKGFHMLNVGIEGELLEYLARFIASNVTLRDKETFDSSVVLNFKPRTKKKILGISLSPVYQVYYDNYEKDKRLATNLMVKVEEWLEDRPGWEVRFFNLNKVDENFNIFASSLLDNSEYRLYQSSVILTLEEISECSAFIGMRYHSCQFAYKTETPLVVINSYPSCKQFAKFVGVNSIDKEQILDGYFKLDFKKASLDINTAKSLAFKGVKI